MSTSLFFNKKSIYSEAFRMAAKHATFFFFSITDGIQLTEEKLFIYASSETAKDEKTTIPVCD